jgi:hypothetical protein
MRIGDPIESYLCVRKQFDLANLVLIIRTGVTLL